MHAIRESSIRIGVIGVGGMGTIHARGLEEGNVPGAVLGGVCDIDPERLAAFPDIPQWNTIDALIAAETLDAVVIATPHPSHVALSLQALEAGLHVLVEKPIAVHKAEAERLINGYTRPDLVFAAMFNQRTDPRYRWVKDRIADGTLGQIQRVSWTITDWFRTQAYYANGAWRATWKGEGGGVLLNQSPHQLDLWQWLFGMPEQVCAFATIGRFHDIEVEDDVTALLDYEGGMTGVFTTTTGEAPGTNRLEIAADHGTVVIEGNRIAFTRNTVPASEFCAASDQPFARPDTESETVEVADHGPQHTGILSNFAAAIRGEETLIAPAPEGIHSVEIANAMLYSALTGQTVRLPLDGAAYARKLQSLIDGSTFRKKVVTRSLSTDDMKASHGGVTQGGSR